MDGSRFEEQWEFLKQFLPEGWEEAAKATRAIRRPSGPLGDPETLLRMLLGRAGGTASHRQTVAYAAASGVASVSNVALHKQERQCGDWLEWIADRLLGETLAELPDSPFRVRLVDATSASRPGSTGTDFRLHVSVELPSRRFTQAELTNARGGESFRRFEIKAGDLLVGDRAYGTASGIAHVLTGGGHVLVRMNCSSLPLFDDDEKEFDPLAFARHVATEEYGEVDCFVRPKEGHLVGGRLCVYALPKEEADRAQERARRGGSKKGRPAGERAIESAKYVMLFTTIPRPLLGVRQAFALYRLRWQVELAFKCLKTVLRFGNLPNHREDTGRTWLLAKLICALLLERAATGTVPSDAFSPGAEGADPRSTPPVAPADPALPLQRPRGRIPRRPSAASAA